MRSNPPEPSSLLNNWRRTRFSDWRVRSVIARLIDAAVAAAGVTLIGTSLIDAVGTFWKNKVFIYPATLEHLAGALLLPCWPWIIISAGMIWGIPRRRGNQWQSRRLVSWRPAAPWAATFAVIVAVIVIGFILGAAKGSLRVLPGGVYQVSTLDLNSAQWTTVSQAEYQRWAARFVREDAFFATFGLAMVGFVAAVRLLRQRLFAVRASDA